MTQDRFDDLMSAISFAEAGEHDKAREFLKGRNTILLAVSDHFMDDNVLKYALNMSRRIGACIDILYLTKTGTRAEQLSGFVQSAGRDGVSCRLVKTDGCMKKAILDYTSKRRQISFVVVGSTPELDIECKTGEKTLTDAWRSLKCPLVVVTKGDMPSLA